MNPRTASHTAPIAPASRTITDLVLEILFFYFLPFISDFFVVVVVVWVVVFWWFSCYVVVGFV